MTGRELIIFIMTNNLENAVLSLEDFALTEVEAAEKFNVGLATIRIWILEGRLNSIEVGDTVFIPKNAEPRL